MQSRHPASQSVLAQGIGGRSDRLDLSVAAYDRLDFTNQLPGTQFPSIKARAGLMWGIRPARCIASMLAWDIDRINLLDRGFCDGPCQCFGTDFLPQLIQKRRLADSFLESFRPSIGLFGSRITAAANHGSQRPASSFVDTTTTAVKPEQRHHCAPVEADYRPAMAAFSACFASIAGECRETSGMSAQVLLSE